MQLVIHVLYAIYCMVFSEVSDVSLNGLEEKKIS